jgi:ribosomal protein L32
MGAQPKRKHSTYRKGKRRVALKRRFLKSVSRQMAGIKNKNENAV